MIGEGHLIKWVLSAKTMEIMRGNAETKCLGLSSSVRRKKTRKNDEELFEDQLIGCMCSYAGNYKMTGTAERYFQHMESTGDSLTGDGGTDIAGARVDFKGTLIRRIGKHPLSFHLAIQPEEFHQDTLYVLALVVSYHEEMAFGWLVGMMEAWEIEIFSRPVPELFGEAFAVKAPELHPVPKMRWQSVL